MKVLRKILSILMLTIWSPYLFGQTVSNDKSKASLVFGLNQPLVTNGFNFEVNYWLKNFVIDYSHGFGLQFKENLVNDASKEQHLNYNIRHSLGIGLGYRFTTDFNIRIEPKLHIWDVYYDDMFKSNKITSYTTYTLGLGAYYKWMPYKTKDNILKGVTIVPSIRWWPNISSSLTDNKFTYFNQKTQITETIKANNIGLSDSPFLANISIGYTFNNK